MVYPKFRGMRLARRLYYARKQLVREKNLMRIVIGGRIPNYEKYQSQLTPEEYVERVMNRGIYDLVLTAQVANGFVLKRILPEYLGADKESGGCATLLEWTNVLYSPRPKRSYNVSRPVRICAVQYGMRKIANFEEFAHQVEYFVDVAGGYRCDFILFPELFTTQLLSFMESMQPGPAARELAKFTPDYIELFSGLAVKYNTNIIGGSHFVVEDDHLYNVSFLFKRNGEIRRQYEIHITPNERFWWGVEPGSSIEVFETDVGKISIQICYNIEFPELSRLAVERGAEIVFVSFNTDERKGYLRVRYCAQARCIENQLFVVIAGTAGNLPQVENMDIQYAQSGILTPLDFVFARDGVAAECNPNVETVVIHDVDIEVLTSQEKGHHP